MDDLRLHGLWFTGVSGKVTYRSFILVFVGFVRLFGLSTECVVAISLKLDSMSVKCFAIKANQ